jgi:hypothetical protein
MSKPTPTLEIVTTKRPKKGATTAVPTLEVAPLPDPKSGGLIVYGTVEKAKEYLFLAANFERSKLFAQVLAGVELLALHKASGVKRGIKKDGEQPKAWEATLDEIGLSRTTAFRLMEMATAAIPRIKKNPDLAKLDLSAISIASLPAPQAKALETTVRGITENRTQADFCNDLGIYNKGAKPKAAASKPSSPKKGDVATSIQAAAQRAADEAESNWFELVQTNLFDYAAAFTVLTDAQVSAQIRALQIALKRRQAWLDTPTDKRNTGLIEDEFRHDVREALADGSLTGSSSYIEPNRYNP